MTGPTGPAAPADALAGAEVLFLSVAGAVDRATLAAAPRLRWIASANAGPPRLDWDAVAARGITVTDSRRGFHRPVAELALALYLALLRDVALHDRALHTPDGTEGADKARNREASRRRLGLVGFGGIGQTLARFLAPLEPELLAYDPYLPPAAVSGGRGAAGGAGGAVPALRGRLRAGAAQPAQPAPDRRAPARPPAPGRGPHRRRAAPGWWTRRPCSSACGPDASAPRWTCSTRSPSRPATPCGRCPTSSSPRTAPGARGEFVPPHRAPLRGRRGALRRRAAAGAHGGRRSGDDAPAGADRRAPDPPALALPPSGTPALGLSRALDGLAGALATRFRQPVPGGAGTPPQVPDD